MENVVSIEGFKTDSLHKYMMPVYAKMNLHQNDLLESKREILQELVPIFFRRMRQYREIELEQISKRHRIPVEQLQMFELGKARSESDFISAYLCECGGFGEYDIFDRQIREFIHPSFKDSRLEHALMAAQVGIMIPGLDYKKLHPEDAKVLTLSRKAEHDKS